MDELLIHLNAGRSCGIPDCCIEWYVDYWLPLWRAGKGKGYVELIERLSLPKPVVSRIPIRPKRWQHVPCPACLARDNFTVLKHRGTVGRKKTK